MSMWKHVWLAFSTSQQQCHSSFLGVSRGQAQAEVRRVARRCIPQSLSHDFRHDPISTAHEGGQRHARKRDRRREPTFALFLRQRSGTVLSIYVRLAQGAKATG